VLNGRLYRGAVGMAAEVGHTIIGLDVTRGVPEPSGRFPQEGSLEVFSSGRALDHLAVEAARQDANSFLGRRLTREDGVTGHDVVDGAKQGDAASIRCLEILGERLGIGIANAINTFDPQEVVIGGGVSAAGDLLLEPARRVAQRHVVPGAGTATRIRLARHGPRAGVLGAALIAAQEWAEEHAGGAGAAVATEAATG
jgi:glucokinase